MGLFNRAKTTAQLDDEIGILLGRAQSLATDLMGVAADEEKAAQAEIDALTRQIAAKSSFIDEVRARASRVKYDVLGEIEELFDTVEDILDGDDEETAEAPAQATEAQG